MSNQQTPPTWVKAVLGVILVAILIGLWNFLAGKIFVQLASVNAKPSMTTLYTYWHFYGSQHNVAVKLYMAMGIAGALCLLPIVIIVALGRQKRSLYGDARWAKPSEIKAAGLLGDTGILVGALKGKYLMFGGSQHVMLAAPTRSGKGVSVVIPNCLNWPDSMVVLDIKQENWNITSGYRHRHGQKCYLFNPAATDKRTHRWNPLSYVSEDAGQRIDDVQKIAGFLYPDIPGSDPIWSASCRSLFLGMTLFLIETPGKPVTIGQVLREAMMGSAERWAKIIQRRNDDGNPLSMECVAALSDYLDTSANTRTSIRKTFTGRLELWLNPIVDAATSGNDFDLRRLRQDRMSIYIGISPDNLSRLGPVINLFLQQVIDLNTRAMPKPEWHKVLLLMDEFTSVGRMPVLSKGAAYIAGYGLRMLPIFQTTAQIKDHELYGAEGARTLSDNHALNIIFAPKNYVDAKEISDELGFTTVKSKSRSRPDAFTKGNKSSSESDQRRELLLPQEVKEIGADAEILFLENCRPIRCKKARYFTDHVFMDRLKLICPDLGKKGKGFPSESELVAAATAGKLAAPVTLIQVGEHDDEQARAAQMEHLAQTMAKQEDQKPVARDATNEDVAAMARGEFDDFSTNFDSVEVPKHPNDMTPDELASLAKAMYASLGAGELVDNDVEEAA